MILLSLSTVHAGDVRVINPRTNPVPVGIVSGTVNGTFTSGIPTVTVTDNDSAQTSATGTNWVQFASHAGSKQVMIFNQTGTSISYRFGTGVDIPIPDNSVIVLGVKANSNELQIKRTDESNSQVVVKFHFEG